jgi:leader peptidase (prepilin peptidase) / N-methyltransferase
VIIVAFFLFGLVIGSFLNVCITRIPAGVSIVSPGSRCPNCGNAVKPYDNVPVLSWLILRGKCRSCGTPISAMYPSIEIVTALLFVACFLCFGTSLHTLKWLFFSSIIVVLIVTDYRDRILPDLVNWFGAGLGLAFATRVPPADGIARMFLPRHAAATLPPWGVKMMFMVGTFFGVRGAFLTVLLGTLLGTVIGVGVIVVLFTSGWKSALAKRASKMGLGGVAGLRWAIASRYQLPLGTFLGIAALLIMFFGPWTRSHWTLFPLG